jgi:hypothetical protein
VCVLTSSSRSVLRESGPYDLELVTLEEQVRPCHPVHFAVDVGAMQALLASDLRLILIKSLHPINRSRNRSLDHQYSAQSLEQGC